jgi:hypothetical protein
LGNYGQIDEISPCRDVPGVDVKMYATWYRESKPDASRLAHQHDIIDREARSAVIHQNLQFIDVALRIMHRHNMGNGMTTVVSTVGISTRRSGDTIITPITTAIL